MLATAKRHSESTIGHQFCVVGVEDAFLLDSYKNGYKHITTNYKPISLLYSFYKIYTKFDTGNSYKNPTRPSKFG
jgi:hypothetical protein